MNEWNVVYLNDILRSKMAEDWSCWSRRGSWRGRLAKVAVDWSGPTAQFSAVESDLLCFRLERTLASCTCRLQHKGNLFRRIPEALGSRFTMLGVVELITNDVTENVTVFCPTLSFNVMNMHWLCVLDQIRQSTRESHGFSPSEILQTQRPPTGFPHLHDFSSHSHLSNKIKIYPYTPTTHTVQYSIKQQKKIKRPFQKYYNYFWSFLFISVIFCQHFSQISYKKKFLYDFFCIFLQINAKFLHLFAKKMNWRKQTVKQQKRLSVFFPPSM